ncbi:MAG: CheY-like chemotaxis protein [Paraglaciecola sp.]|jgi:CheY-like chemotaxis protein
MDWLKIDDETEEKITKMPWKILVVDDEKAVFDVTKLALGSFEFEGRPLIFLYANSGEAAKQIFNQHHDIALALVDVIMESDDAGLRLVEHIRNSMENHYTRIVLRTGQPGNAPENEIIRSYDIDGYKSKTDLNHQSLTYCFYTSLRSYRDLVRIQSFQQGLEALVESLLSMQTLESFDTLTDSLMLQLRAVLSAYDSEFVIKLKALDGCFVFDDVIKRFNAADQSNQQQYNSIIQKCLTTKVNFEDNDFYAHYNGNDTYESVLLIVGAKHCNKYSRRLIELFSQNVCVLLEKLSEK